MVYFYSAIWQLFWFWLKEILSRQLVVQPWSGGEDIDRGKVLEVKNPSQEYPEEVFASK